MPKRCCGCMKLKKSSPICEHCGYDERMQNLPHQLPIGTVLGGQYVIGRALGQGGFGITYIGWDSALETVVAIKEYYPNSFVTRDSTVSLNVLAAGEQAEDIFQHNREKFLNEARIMAKLSYVPTIVRVYRLFSENNTAYFSMEYLSGCNLKEYLIQRQRGLTVEQTLSILRAPAEALQQIHGMDLVHRDISPDNIMLLEDGSVKLLDFGATKEVESPQVGKDLPASTNILLKHGFAPLEQYRTRGDMGPWTDVYALCATIYYCLTGIRPNSSPDRFQGTDNVDWTRIDGLSQRQISALQKGMANLPENRIRTITELWTELTEVQPHPVPSDPLHIPRLLPLLAGVLAAVACMVWLFWPEKPATADNMMQSALQTVVQTFPAENGTAELVPPSEVTMTEAPAWEKNLLMADPLSQFEAFDQTEIVSVVFWDSVGNAPASSWDVSEAQDGSVRAWTEENGEYYTLCYAADGGINGANACRKLFFGYQNLIDIQFNHSFHTDEATDMVEMFSGCRSITTLDLTQLDTRNVQNMSAMFSNCSNLRTLDLSSLDTSQVTNMSHMFGFCSHLAELDFGGMDTGAVVNMNGMFTHCQELTQLDLDGFDTSRVTNMSSMFSDCGELISVNLSSFSTLHVTDMSYMFSGCSSLVELDLGSFDTGIVSNMCEMFSYCESLAQLDLSSFDFSGVLDLSGMFTYCTDLTSLELGEFRLARDVNLQDMYYGCYKLPTGAKRLR